MNNELLSIYNEVSDQFLPVNASGSGNAITHYENLHAALPTLLMAVYAQRSKKSQWMICRDRESAAYMYDTLNQLLKGENLHYFPDSFKRAGKLDEISNDHILYRTETLSALTDASLAPQIVVSYPEAVAEKAPDLRSIKRKTIKISKNANLDIEELTALLVEYGFEFTDFVFEPGQFSIRGGIIDIFSFAQEFPYRVELFDTEVESIRLFDPSSQLSQKKISRVKISPNIKTEYGKITKLPIFEIIPNDCIFWLENFQEAEDLLTQLFRAANEFNQNQSDELNDEDHFLLNHTASEVFLNYEELFKQIGLFHLVEFGKNKSFQATEKIAYANENQIPFNKNFDLLIENLKLHIENGYQINICSDQNKQLNRLQSIFDDLDGNLKFNPIPLALHAGFIDHDLKQVVYTDHQIFNRYHKYHLKQGFSKDKALLLKQLNELKPGDFVTHIDHGVGVYGGLTKIDVNGTQQEAVRIRYANNDVLYVSIHSLHKVSKYSGKEGSTPKIHKLGSDAWNNLKNRTKKKIKDIAEDLIRLYAKRKAQQGFAFAADGYLQNELEASFMFEDTPDQEKSTTDVKNDMESSKPMDRLICGDVGFGKTEIAIRATFKAVVNGKQVAVLVPTTILAFQHNESFKERLENFGVRVEYLNRFKTSAEKKAILQDLEKGKVDVIIGTHALVSKSVKFKDLGLLVVDEEQKFGVGVKEKLKELKVNVDTLTLTATPIPRTLQFSLMGARDLSVIQTAPPNRQPVHTEVKTFNSDVIRDAIEYEVNRGGQVFFVHNKVKDLQEIIGMLQRLCPTVDFISAHGQLDGKQLEDVMMKFINRKADVLVSTNIIESGLNIPNANTIIINNAHWFGLSDLHQLRGRVGRSDKKAFCYLISPPFSTLTQDARQRLRAIEEFADLGSGFNIAMRDLDIRGAGNILGAEQSGYISEVGFDAYHKILDEAINELKNSEEFEDLYAQTNETKQYISDCTVESDEALQIPDEYVSSINERMKLYTRLNELKNDDELFAFQTEMEDRFGALPKEVFALFDAIRLKWLALKMGIVRIIIRKNVVRCYFIEDENSRFFQTEIFGKMLANIQKRSAIMQLVQRDNKLFLQINKLSGINDLISELNLLVS